MHHSRSMSICGSPAQWLPARRFRYQCFFFLSPMNRFLMWGLPHVMNLFMSSTGGRPTPEVSSSVSFYLLYCFFFVKSISIRGVGGTTSHEQVHHVGHPPRKETVHDLRGRASLFMVSAVEGPHEQIHHVGKAPRDESSPEGSPPPTS